MYLIKRIFSILICALILLVGVSGGYFSEWTADQTSLIEIALELELEGEEEVKIVCLSYDSLEIETIAQTLLDHKAGWFFLLFTSLDLKAAENPPENLI